jgi:hypothetical protein
MAMLEPQTVMTEFNTQRGVDTDRLFRSRSELREVVAGTRSTLAESQKLIDEIGTALAPGQRVMLRQPRQADIPLAAHWDDLSVR